MRTRLFVVAAAIGLGACVHQGGGLPPLKVVEPTGPRELLPEEQIQQALNRLTFGPRPSEAEQVRAMGVDKWIALQLAPERIDDRQTDELVAQAYPSLALSSQQIVQLYQDAQRAQVERQKQLAAQGDTNARRDARAEIRQDPDLAMKIRNAQRTFGELQSAKLARAVSSNRQLDEVMTDFWENHFSVFAGKGQTRYFLTSYDRDVIRPHALGRFRDLLGAVAKSPAMLFFLDNWQSSADSLHPTLAANGQRMAQPGPRQIPRRILETGQLPPAIDRQLPPDIRQQWNNARTPEERERILREVQTRAQRRRPNGLNENYARELMELHTLGVDGGYTQHDVIEVARALTGWSIDLRDGSFIFRPQLHDAGQKVVLGHVLPADRGIEDGEEVLDILARSPATAHFIAKKLVIRFVSDSAPPELVNRAAATYMQTDGDIREVVRTIVTSQEFFSRAAFHAKVKTPFELVASALRAMNAAPDTTPRSAQFVAQLGEPIFGHMTPEGWPERGDAWMNTGAILNRINFGLVVAAGRMPGAQQRNWPYPADLRSAPRSVQVEAVSKTLFGGEMSSETRSVLLNGENPLVRKYAAVRESAGVDTTASMSNMSNMQVMEPAGGFGPRRQVARPVALRGQIDLTGLPQVVGLALGAPEFQRR